MQQPHRMAAEIPDDWQELTGMVRRADVIIALAMPDERPHLLWGVDAITRLATPIVARFIIRNTGDRLQLERAVGQTKRIDETCRPASCLTR